MNPITPSIASVVSAGRSPLTTNAISVSPPSVVNHGASTRNCLQRQQQLLEDEDADSAR